LLFFSIKFAHYGKVVFSQAYLISNFFSRNVGWNNENNAS